MGWAARALLLALAAAGARAQPASFRPLEWRFVRQQGHRVTLRVALSDNATTHSAPLRHNAFIALPIGASIQCATPDHEKYLRLFEPEPFRNIALARVLLFDFWEKAKSADALEKTFDFVISDAPAPRPAEVSVCADGHLRNAMDLVAEAVAINAPLADLAAGAFQSERPRPNPALTPRAWAFPPECAEAVEVATPDVKGRLEVRALDLLTVFQTPRSEMFAALEQLRLWHEGRPLAFQVSEKPLTPFTKILFAAPASARPYLEGSRIYATFSPARLEEPAAPAAPVATVAMRDAAPVTIRPEWMRLVRRPDWDLTQIHADGRRPPRPTSPTRSTKTPPFLPPSPRQTRGADILIVTTPDFRKALEPLVAYRRRQGCRVEVVDVGDAYLCFSAGLPRPMAIRALAAHAFEHWAPPAPTYLLLVGDASLHFGDETTTLVANQVPSFYENNQVTEQTPADDAGFARFLGRGEFPAMMVGRLSAREPAEARAIAEKIVRYETELPLGPWRARALWMLDAGYEHLFQPDVAREPQALATRNLEVNDFPFIDHYHPLMLGAKLSPPCNYEMMGRLSDGCLVMHYAGHGGVTLLSKQKVFFWKDVPRLENGMRLPFYTQVTCFTGNFDFPIRPYTASIGELILRKADGGGIGVFAATRDLPGDEYALQSGIFRGLYGRPEQRRTLGMATTEAKMWLVLAQGGRLPFSDSYVLLGDPATPFTWPPNALELTVTPGQIDAPGPAILQVRGAAREHVPAEIQALCRLCVTDAGQHRDMRTVSPSIPDSADVWVSLLDDKGRELQTARTTLKNRAFDARLEVPFGVEAPRLKVVAYAAHSRRSWEAVGAADIAVAPMRLRHAESTTGPAQVSFLPRSFRTSGRQDELVDGETVFFDFRLANSGGPGRAPTHVTLTRRRYGMPYSRRRVVCEQLAPPFQAGEIRSIRLRWDDVHTSGAHLFEIEIAGPETVRPTRSGDILVEVHAKPDLRIERFDVTPRKGAVRAELSVANRGGSKTLPTTARISCIDDTGTTLTLAAAIETPPLAPGETIRLGPLELQLPPSASAPLRLLANVDVYQDHAELNEDNNESATTTSNPD